MADKLVSILETFGDKAKGFFEKELPVAVNAAEVAEPIVDIAFPGIGVLYNTTVAMVANAELAAANAGKQSGSGPQKLAFVVSSLEPIAIQYLQTQGISANPAQITAWVNAVVASLNALSQLQTPTA